MAKAKKNNVLSLEEKLEQALVPVEEWPYEVPGNWCWVKLGQISDVKGGKRVPKGESLSDEVTTHPYIRVTDMKNGTIDMKDIKYVSDNIFGVIHNYTISKSDVYISVAGSIGKIGSIPDILDGANLTENAAKITNIIGTDNVFLKHYLHSEIAQLQMKESTISTTQPKLALFRIEDISVPLPPVAEQKRIVEQIESLFAKLDEVKEKLEMALSGFQIRKISVLHNAFTGQLTKSWRDKQGKSKTSYRKEKLQNLTSIIGDGLHGTPSYDECGEYYFVNGNNFSGKSIEIKADTKTVNAEEFKKYKKNLSAQSTVFVSINGTLGKTAFYNNEPIILGKSACYLNVLSELNKYYLRYYFETEEFMQYANEKATGSTIKNLGLKAIRELQISVPPIEEQDEIVRLLDRFFDKENEAIEKTKAVLERVELLKKSILAKAFHGELGTNNSEEESSIELLKQILSEV